MSFDGKESIALCVLANRNAVIGQTKQKRSTRHRKKKIHRVYNRAVMYHMRKKIVGFLTKHGSTVHDIVWQCDDGRRNVVKENGLKCGHTGSAYRLAGVVAWANSRNTEARGTIDVGLTDRIREELAKALKWQNGDAGVTS